MATTYFVQSAAQFYAVGRGVRNSIHNGVHGIWAKTDSREGDRDQHDHPHGHGHGLMGFQHLNYDGTELLN